MYHLRSRRPKRIILIRHGESEANVQKDLYSVIPDNKIPLTPLGHMQARAVGQKIKEMLGPNARVHFLVSPLQRTLQTFCDIATHFDPAMYTWREDPRLREQEWGNYQDAEKLGRIFEERNSYGRFYYRFDNGESGADVYDRVTDFLGSLFREMDKHPKGVPDPDAYVIITHGLTMRFFLMRYYKWKIQRFERVWNPGNCEAWTLELGDDGSYHLMTPLHEDAITDAPQHLAAPH